MDLNEEEKGMLNEMWPDLSTVEGTRFAAKLGGMVAMIVATITLMLCLLSTTRRFGSMLHITAWSVVDVVLFLLIATRLLQRPSRLAAVAGLGLFIARPAVELYLLGRYSAMLVAVLLGWYLLNAVRASFSYHALIKANPQAALPRRGSLGKRR